MLLLLCLTLRLFFLRLVDQSKVFKNRNPFQSICMDPEAAQAARESLELAFHMSNILDTGLDRHTLSVLITLCDLGLNPEALAAVVKELRRDPCPSTSMPETQSSIS